MQVVYSKQAIKYLFKLDKPTIYRINNAIEQLLYEPPKGDIKPLKGQENIYRLRVGDYRILFEIDLENDIIVISRIAPRGEVYK